MKALFATIVVVLASLDSSLGEKYDFGIFENFVANADIFVKEQDIVHQLEITRDTLNKNKRALQQMNSTFQESGSAAKSLLNYQVCSLGPSVCVFS